jgi:hypothetical protein
MSLLVYATLRSGLRSFNICCEAPMKYLLGNGKKFAEIIFANVALRTLTEGNVHRIIHKILTQTVRASISEGDINHYIAYVENATPNVQKALCADMLISGQIEYRTHEFVKAVLNEKEEHRKPAYRKAGNVSTHPMQFLTSRTLLIVMGHRRFLTDVVDLALEREGRLKQHSIEIIKEVAELSTTRPSGRRVNYFHVIIADKLWYRGYIEALGKTVPRRTTAELLEHLAEK